MKATALTILPSSLFLGSALLPGCSSLAFQSSRHVPALSRRDTTCIADSCQSFSNELKYCFDLLSGPVYGPYGSALAQAEGPSTYFCPSIRSCSIIETDVDCVCGNVNSDPKGWAAALSCYFCEIPDSTIQVPAEYTELVQDWVVTCDTWGNVSPSAAVNCWNSGLQQDCWSPDSKK